MIDSIFISDIPLIDKIAYVTTSLIVVAGCALLTSSRQWKKLSFQITSVFIAVFLILGTTLIYVGNNLVRKQILTSSFKQENLTAELIMKHLENRLYIAETLASSIANAANNLPKDVELFKTILPNIINYKGTRKYVAGGGFWPEPNLFTNNTERRSFFWGRKNDGSLKYFDDYNDPKGNGYHNEEWYVPARFKNNQSCYWSKSYVDPYSLQAMVTCTIPIMDDKKFTGVATIDLRLEGLDKMLIENTRAFGGYGFILDRNNKLVSFPDEKLARVGGKNPDSIKATDYINIHALVEREPNFRDIALKVSDINRERINSIKKQDSEQFNSISQQIDKDSYQIDDREALLIASVLNTSDKKEDYSISTLTISNDPMLGGEVYVKIHLLKDTLWKLVLVTPVNRVAAEANRISKEIIIITIGSLVLLLGVFYIYLGKVLLLPVQKIISTLSKGKFAASQQVIGSEHISEPAALDESIKNELGIIAYWYNFRNRQLIEAKEAAEQANRIKSEFLSNMSHELRTPMHAVLNYAKMGLTRLDKEDPEKIKKYFGNIQIAGDRLLGLLNNLLDLAKMESGKMDFKLDYGDFNDVIDHTLIEIDSLLKEKSLQLVIDKSERTQAVFDKKRMIQVMVNLLSNSIKFSPEKSTIRINLSEVCLLEHKDALCCAISDEGDGIPETELEAIFDKFIQSSKTITGAGGTGLGLSICREIVNAHGGKIWAENGKYKGAVFSFIIPINKQNTN